MQKIILDKSFFKFILVGIINTLFGTFIMFVAYNFLNLNYWLSSAANYFFGSILSYFLNKNFTFKRNNSTDLKMIIRFIVNILTCYILAYGVPKILIGKMFLNITTNVLDNILMILGMILFVLLNYLGQRYFVFKK